MKSQGNKDKNKQGSQANAQSNGTKPRICTNPLAQLAFNGPSKTLDEYWKNCLREVSKEKKKEEQKNPSFLESDWLELRQHIHQAYHAIEESKPDAAPQKNPRIAKVIKRLCNKDSQQLLLFLESQVQEFVIEVKVGLLELLSKNAPGVQLSRTFLTGLVDAYGRLCSGAKKLAPPLKGVEEKHLSMFGMSWEDLNKLLFERCVHADPVMKLKVPQFIGIFHASLPAKDKNSFYGIFQSILALEDEMTVIAAKWKKVETFVHEKNVASLSSMVDELRLDAGGTPAERSARAAAAAAAAKEQCECKICTSPLLQQLSSMGLTSQNYKEVRERLRKMLDQKAQGLKAKAAAASVAAAASSQPSKPTTQGKTAPVQPIANANNAGAQKNQGKQKASQQKGKSHSNASNNAKQANSAPKHVTVPTPTPVPAPVPGKPGSAKTPAPFPPYVKHVPPAPAPTPVVNSKQSASNKQRNCATNLKHQTCSCHEGKMVRTPRRVAVHIPSDSSSSSSTQPSTPVRDPRDIDALVDFIEGTDRVQVHHKNEKKAAKKARQKLKKVEEQQMQLEMEMDDYYDDEDPEEEEEEEVPPPASAVVRVARAPPAPSLPIPSRQQNTQQARKGSPQMVTIRRVMEHSSAEPTVTITLKGDTPEKDTVLFTLVNGQVCKDEENAKASKGKGKEQQQSHRGQQANSQQGGDTKSKKKKKGEAAKTNNNNNQGKVAAAPTPKPHVTVTPIPPRPMSTAGTILEPVSYLPSGPSQPPPRPSSNSLLFTNQNSPGLGAFYAPATLRPSAIPSQPIQNSAINKNFTLDSIKLPPGITITKVEAPQHPQYPQHLTNGNSMPNNEPPPDMRQHYMPPLAPLPPGVTLANPRGMGGMHGMQAAMGMGGGMGMANPNVIVVDTGKLIEDNKNSKHKNQQNNSEQDNTKGTNVRGLHRGEYSEMTQAGNYVTVKRIPQAQDEYESAISISMMPTNCDTAGQNGDNDSNAPIKKKKNKKKNKGKKVDDVESVFTPKDIDLDAVDDDERELEAFKRFCFNSVPRERKEKVHLNIKDLVIKKKP